MPRTSIEPRFFPNKIKIKIKPELNKTKSNLPPNKEMFKQKLISGNGFIVYR